MVLSLSNYYTSAERVGCYVESSFELHIFTFLNSFKTQSDINTEFCVVIFNISTQSPADNNFMHNTFYTVLYGSYNDRHNSLILTCIVIDESCAILSLNHYNIIMSSVKYKLNEI
jgi:hypothetical protein